MRETKYRVWIKDEERMVYPKEGERFISLDGSYYKIIYNLANEKKCTLLKEEDSNIEIMQYVGLNDKNGVNIYERDIIAEESTYPLEVIWMGLAWGVSWYEDENREEQILSPEVGDWDIENERFKYFKVIGNIYENSELIGESHED